MTALCVSAVTRERRGPRCVGRLFERPPATPPRRPPPCARPASRRRSGCRPASAADSRRRAAAASPLRPVEHRDRLLAAFAVLGQRGRTRSLTSGVRVRRHHAVAVDDARARWPRASNSAASSGVAAAETGLGRRRHDAALERQRHGVGRRAGRGDRAEQPGAVAGQLWPPVWLRCPRTLAARRRRRSRVRRGRPRPRRSVVGRVVGRRDVVGSPVIRAISSDSASACSDRSAATAVSAGRDRRRLRRGAAASLASSLSLRARSSCAMRSSRSGGGGGLPHAAAVAAERGQRCAVRAARAAC